MRGSQGNAGMTLRAILGSQLLPLSLRSIPSHCVISSFISPCAPCDDTLPCYRPNDSGLKSLKSSAKMNIFLSTLIQVFVTITGSWLTQ